MYKDTIDLGSFRPHLFESIPYIEENDYILDVKPRKKHETNIFALFGENLLNKCYENRLYSLNIDNNITFKEIYKFSLVGIEEFNSKIVRMKIFNDCFLIGLENGNFYEADFNELLSKIPKVITVPE